MTPFERLRELESKATPGPWAKCTAHEGKCSCTAIWSIPADAPVLEITRKWGDGAEGTDTWIEYGTVSEEAVQANKEFVAESRNLLPALLNSHAALLAALKPFAAFACDPPCECHNCVARAAITTAEKEQP